MQSIEQARANIAQILRDAGITPRPIFTDPIQGQTISSNTYRSN